MKRRSFEKGEKRLLRYQIEPAKNEDKGFQRKTQLIVNKMEVEIETET